jgi:CBS domain-containing protein
MTIATDTEVRQVMQTNLVTVQPKTSLFEAAKLMDEENVGTVLVVDSGNKLLGLVTDRQIIVRAVAHKRDLSTTTAEEIMTKWPMTIFPETTCKEALDIMGDYGYRRLPVEKNGKLVGIISLSDLAPVAEFDDECIADMVKELSTDARYK